MVEFYDIVFVADPRFSGGTSTALAAEIEAASRAGLSAAILPVMGPILRKAWPFHPAISEAIEAGRVALIDRGQAVRATFGILHHPGVFEGMPVEWPGLLAETLILVLHHPPRDGRGISQYDLQVIIENVSAGFGAMPVLAPVGPLVREQLSTVDLASAEVTSEDWSNLIDLDAWPARDKLPVGRPIRIGRHSRPLPQKWPATRELALAAYPQRSDFEILMLGADPVRLARLYGTIPQQWQLMPFGAMPVREFLSGLDFWVYFHAPEWVEAFGRAILEAAATGLAVILPAHFEPVFGPAAIYCAEDEVAEVIEELAGDERRYAHQVARARVHVSDRFGLNRFSERLETMRPDWSGLAGARPSTAPRPLRRARKTALMVTSNGVGLGHLTRMLAIADRMPAEIEPVFFTLSQAANLVGEAGYAVEFRPFHRTTGADIQAWNRALAEELSDALAFYAPAVLVFDGNMPYQGLCDALVVAPEVISIWMRRAFWTDGHAGALSRSDQFDAVIEPADLAETLDLGPTVAHRESVHRVAPIIRGDPQSRPDRAEARSTLGLPAKGLIGLVALGAQTNFDLSPVCDEIAAWSARRPDVTLVQLVPWIGTAWPPIPDAIPLQRYPIFPLTKAFDFQIATCGYNAFHEAMLGEIPTVFVPNEAGEMDLQIERARFGALAGASLTLRRDTTLSAARTFDRIAERQQQDLMREAARRLPRATGAAPTARFICEYASLRRIQSTGPS